MHISLGTALLPPTSPLQACESVTPHEGTEEDPCASALSRPLTFTNQSLRLLAKALLPSVSSTALGAFSYSFDLLTTPPDLLPHLDLARPTCPSGPDPGPVVGISPAHWDLSLLTAARHSLLCLQMEREGILWRPSIITPSHWAHSRYHPPGPCLLPDAKQFTQDSCFPKGKTPR